MEAGLRIRIHLIRIRVQHFRLNTDPDPIRIRALFLTQIFFVFLIRIGSEFNQVSGSVSGFGIRIQQGKNDPQK